MRTALRLFVCISLALAFAYGYYLYTNATVTVQLESSNASPVIAFGHNPTIQPWNGGTVYIDENDKTREVGSAGEQVDVHRKVRLKGGMRVSTGISAITVKVGRRLAVKVPPLCSVLINQAGQVAVEELIPRQLEVTGATLLTVKLANSVSATDCDNVVGTGAAQIHAKGCRKVSVNTFATVTAVDCSEVNGDDNSSITATNARLVTGNGLCHVTARDCYHVIGTGHATVRFKHCTIVETSDEATQENTEGK
jgi:hypothetical protein